MCRHRLGDLRRREEKKKRIQRPGREGRRLDFCEEKKTKNDELCSKEQRATSNLCGWRLQSGVGWRRIVVAVAVAVAAAAVGRLGVR
jgi:hypothetical protein